MVELRNCNLPCFTVFLVHVFFCSYSCYASLSARKLEKSFHLLICVGFMKFCPCLFCFILQVGLIKLSLFVCFHTIIARWLLFVRLCCLFCFFLFCCIELAIRGKLDCLFVLYNGVCFGLLHFIICKYKYWLYMIYFGYFTWIWICNDN